MFIEVLPWTVGAMGAGAGVWALVFRRKNGNGKHDPWQHAERLAKEFGPVQQQASAPVQVQWPPELAALLTHITERLEAALTRAESDAAEGDKRLTRIASDLSENMADSMARFYAKVSTDMMTVPNPGLERLTERIEALLRIPPPAQPDFEPVVARLEELVASMPEPDQRPELEAELVRQLAELPQRVGRSVSDAVAERKPPPRNLAPPEKAKNNPPGPPKSAPRNFALNPNEQPATPSIPAPYVPGTVDVPAGQPWSLLYLIQKQLSPNCPGTSVSFAISAEGGTVYVGGASQIGGKLSEENYAYKLEDGDPPVRYQSSYPGGNTPVGEIQVLSTGGGKLHVEVQS